MLSGPEILILLVIVAIAVGLIALAARSGPRTDADTINTILVPTDAHGWLVGVMGDVAALPKHSVDWLSHDVAIVTWTRRSGWVFVVVLLLFPLGLLALLFTTTVHGTIAVVDDGPPGTVALGGQFSNAAVDAVNALLPS